MAKSKSKSTAPTTADGTLSAFKQDLFKILDGLQTQITTDASTESAALNKFIEAEGNLVAKSIEFGGPSPYFISPTWSGSKTSNGSKSYEKEFRPIIKQVLSQKTAAQDEAQINTDELETNLLNVFKVVFEGMTIPAGKMQAEVGIDWVGSSIFESKAYLSVKDQEGLFIQMNTAIFKGTNLPSDNTFKSYGAWAKDQISTYLKTISKQGPDIEKLTTQILDYLHSTLNKYQQNDEESIRQWIQVSISGLPKTIAVTNLQKEELIGALEQEVTRLFPQPDASFFYSNLQTILMQNIYNPPPSTVMSNKVAGVAPPANLSVFITIDNDADTLTAHVSGGNKPSQGYIYKWIDDKGAAVPNGTKSVASGLAEGTYQVEVSDGLNTVTSDKATIYPKSKLKVAISPDGSQLKNVSINGGSDGAAQVEITGGTKPYKVTWKNTTSGDTTSGRNGTNNTGATNTASNLSAGDYLVTVEDKKNAIASVVITISQPSYSAQNGIKYVIDQIVGVDNTKKNPSAADKAKKETADKLENAIKEVVKIAIAKTFNDLPEYGAQGHLISTTYDYQLISRISDYTSALVDELKTDYNAFIPTNSQNALTAAQEITSTAVAFREFAMSLSSIVDAFESESNHTEPSGPVKKGQPGFTYNEIKKLIYNDPNPYLTDLGKLADAIYLSTGKNEPLIKRAELEGVTLASSTAGLNTSLSKLLTGQESAALDSLDRMKANAKANYEAAYKAYDKNATNYFDEMDEYISIKQEFNYDMLKLDAVNNALETLTNVIETGISHSGFTNVYAKT